MIRLCTDMQVDNCAHWSQRQTHAKEKVPCDPSYSDNRIFFCEKPTFRTSKQSVFKGDITM